MLKFKSIFERWTIIGIAILMVLALGLLARSLAHNKERAQQLAMLALDRTLDSQNWRLRLLTNTFIWDLEEEAGFLELNDSTTDRQLIERWLPVLRSRYAINAIGVANDRGDERVLHHLDSMWRFTRTVRSIPPARAIEYNWPLRQREIPTPVASGTAEGDPRETIWFSQAMEDRQDEPVWSENDDTDAMGSLHLSMLIRGSTNDAAYRVIHIDLDAEAMLAGLTQWTPQISTIELTSKGRPLTPFDTSYIGRAWKTVLGDWEADRSTSEFRSTVDEKRWVGRILPLDLNGTKIYTGVMIGFDALERWNMEGRMALWFVLGLLVLLGLMLVMVFIQSRSEERRARRQERRSDLQAKHLAQAIGEREVLDREVHHRVKNNLQVVSSLLNLQAQRIPGDEARSEFMRGKRRIDSMALVHHKLYRQTDLSAVDLGIFLDDLAKAVAAMFAPESRSVSHSVDTGGIRSDADTSIQLGMILCELLANCHQHAFPYATGGHIEITVKDAGEGNLVLSVKDNGKGFEKSDIRETHLGLEVAEALTDQLDGTMRLAHDGGTTVEVVFRKNRHA